MTDRLGAHLVPGGIMFAVRARDAEFVELCLFKEGQETRVSLQRDGDLFRTFLANAGPGLRYGYRASGPWSPEQGCFFDPSKLLVDPYALLLDERFKFDPRLAIRGVDTAGLAPKAVVTAPLPSIAPRAPVFRPGGLIYELNVRSFTRLHFEIPPHLRGTIGALRHPAVISHLRKLHVNAVELMPVVACLDERHLPPLGLRNSWGYNPVVPMALDPGLVPGGIQELRDTVETLREAGIGVILDLVLNHTAESDLRGPTLSLRGLDNRCYARGQDGTLINDTGTGNTLMASDAPVRDLIVATLRHFAGNCGVDGFRFDLATVLAREPGFNPHAPIFEAIKQDPLLADRVLIAEPWDVGPGGYQLGKFPSTWLEWNDRYRDDVRRFWRGDASMAGRLATRIAGSSDVFEGEKTRTVNFIASHDGFALADLVSFEQRHNEANGEVNRDGQQENYSWNNGAEGPSTDPDVVRRRKEDARALLATLFASRGTIMLTAGDEFGRSQNGNNNAYAQDNAVTWLDWSNRDLALENFVAQCAAFRAISPQLRELTFLKDVDWCDLDNMPMTPEKWDTPDCAGFELRLPLDDCDAVILRFDRIRRVVSISRVNDGLNGGQFQSSHGLPSQ
jgi:glycogen operon protein